MVPLHSFSFSFPNRSILPPLSLLKARRTLTYMNFLAKPAAVLFATDIAARGLDFPEVDWVVQVYMGNHNHID